MWNSNFPSIPLFYFSKQSHVEPFFIELLQIVCTPCIVKKHRCMCYINAHIFSNAGDIFSPDSEKFAAANRRTREISANDV